MKKLVSILLAGVMALSLAACGGSNGGSATLPKNIEVQLPAAAGGGTDVVARALTTYMNQNGDSTYTIQNNTDGNGVVAYETIRTAKADGSKILFFHSTMLINTATGNYDHSASNPDDFKVIGAATPTQQGGYVLVVKAGGDIQNLEDFIAAAKAAGGSYQIGVQTGGSTHLMAGMMAIEMGIDLNYVEAGSDTEKLTNIVGGNIDSALVNANQAKQYVEAGEVIALGSFAIDEKGGRCENLPDCPSFIEQGYNLTFATNFLVLGPKDMSDELAKQIHDAFATAAEDPDTKAILESSGMAMTFAPYEDGPAILKAQQEQLSTVCEVLGLVK